MSKHEITIIFEDGRTVHVPAGEDETIYLACLMTALVYVSYLIVS